MVPSRAPRSAPVHTHPDDVSLLTALAALADPVRYAIVCDLAGSAEWDRTCGSFDVPVRKAALSHHFAVLRAAGLVEQRDIGARRVNRLRRAEFGARFPGLLELVLRQGSPPQSSLAQSSPPPARTRPDS
jgi:DNA-binding transcriptional ArsR family regulator